MTDDFSYQFYRNRLTENLYYEEIKRDLKRILIYECRCNERLKDEGEGSTRVTHTGFREALEHLKNVTFIINNR